MIEVASLGSGSNGNATLVRTAETTLLLDCGFTLKETLKRLSQLGVDPSAIDAVLVTHEHGDHLKGVGPLSRKFRLPVWMTCGTYNATRDKRIADLHLFHAHGHTFEIGDIRLAPFPMPHDAAEACQFIFQHDHHRVAALTDLGAPSRFVLEQVREVDLLILETNYDPDMLRSGPYPPGLQNRISSNWGHLSNFQAGELLNSIDHPRLQRVLLGHLSEKNNQPALALDTVAAHVSDGRQRLQVLQQHACSNWIRLE